ncbi:MULTISPECIES: DUF1573 domain-containing protein [Salegentibacter]|jgi:uncharacterized cupredoxin-like copper-binding protein|uniref:DUF1573 domain-containing protein n=1 Tax=Salegentibacter agarivorans TaxID=345907 RepID=A0A1I2P7N0_9FLAO|nr:MULTISPECIES: DUF1573 domain-containing protein [Salegentibacter]APS40440.1 hypothetical protein AO058_16865 [Salegentibacter sp. T436]MBO2545956.1 DUF1573 domain-containing protein [Salegentibacter sp. BDJ18]SFG12128.1 Protein of unknown function [Salegentibacter agarivorans]|tara:strand:+ start:240 stop:704 length:465 start_codon:yes stop_codon:yes gene_type:complete
MKNGILMLAAVGALLFTSCKENNNNASEKVKAENVESAAERDAQATVYPKMEFEKSEHDFGNIPKGENVEHTFTFTNTGQAPLVITNAKSTCGCTVPTWTKEPIQPGESGEMLVKFNGSGKGQVTKTVTVTANTEAGTERLRIKAFVETEENAS